MAKQSVNQYIRRCAKLAVYVMCEILDCKRTWFLSSHRPEACDGRAMIYLWLKQDMGLSTVTTGRLFGRDHSTIYSALKHISGILDTEPDIMARYQEFEWKMS